jgi:hypothetical protein
MTEINNRALQRSVQPLANARFRSLLQGVDRGMASTLGRVRVRIRHDGKKRHKCIFLGPDRFPRRFTSALRKVDFRENSGDLNGTMKPRVDSAGDKVLPTRDWRIQLKMIKDVTLGKI